jgi:hypothetical protein
MTIEGNVKDIIKDIAIVGVITKNLEYHCTQGKIFQALL